MRLVTFNILNGRSTRDGRVDAERFARAVRSLDADILGLQEVDRHQERSGGTDLTAVAAESMGAREHRFVAALSGTPGATWTAATGDEQPDTAAYGVALLSRYPVRSWEVIRLPALPGRVPMVLAGRRPRLVSDEPRVAVSALLDTPSGTICVATTHLSFVHGWNALQLRRVVRALGTNPAPRVLMGDLNMSPGTARRLSGMQSAAAALTFPAAAPTRQLDHILIDGLPGGFHGAVHELELSDHRALAVDVDPSGLPGRARA
jgi:endonuclease/exonuclease/phosphatase family metal-dependent hydrolase